MNIWTCEDVEHTYHLHSCCTHPEYPSRSSPGPCGTNSAERERGGLLFCLFNVVYRANIQQHGKHIPNSENINPPKNSACHHHHMNKLCKIYTWSYLRNGYSLCFLKFYRVHVNFTIERFISKIPFCKSLLLHNSILPSNMLLLFIISLYIS